MRTYAFLAKKTWDFRNLWYVSTDKRRGGWAGADIFRTRREG